MSSQIKLCVSSEIESDNHGNYDFKLGSSAEVEPLWSVVDSLIDKDWNSNAPLLMELIVFLQVNREFWNSKPIVKAYCSARETNSEFREGSMFLEDDFFCYKPWFLMFVVQK